ncbi:MAG TPA: hypothetical protein VHU81_20150 [Thermoanaerobaculia bacterium]|nr:hypothetical protein [Thermoanaerobaculia bacterium]
MENPEAAFGKPDFRLGRLFLWVQGFENDEAPQADNVHDANWLRIAAFYASKGSRVLVSGGHLLTFELEKWLGELRQVQDEMEGTAILEPLEPNLRVELTADSLGHLALQVEISPDPGSQEHLFREELDPSILPGRIRELEEICRKYPARNP